jgi:hypothetical protein
LIIIGAFGKVSLVIHKTTSKDFIDFEGLFSHKTEILRNGKSHEIYEEELFAQRGGKEDVC